MKPELSMEWARPELLFVLLLLVLVAELLYVVAWQDARIVDLEARAAQPRSRRPAKSVLSRRELEVVDAYAETGSWRGTAAALGTAEQTVRNQAHGAFRKLGVTTVGQAIAITRRR